MASGFVLFYAVCAKSRDLYLKNGEVIILLLSDLYYKLARQTVDSHATTYDVQHYGNMHTNTAGEFFKGE